MARRGRKAQVCYFRFSAKCAEKAFVKAAISGFSPPNGSSVKFGGGAGGRACG